MRGPDMLTIAFDKKKVDELAKVLAGTKKKVSREMKIAVNATAKKTKTEVSKQIRAELAVKAKVVKETISVTKATDSLAGAVVMVKQTKRIPLRDFGARQTKKGVSYKISKKGGRKFVAGAFQGPRPGAMKASWRGRVFKRIGKERLPITQLWGPSPWGAMVKKKMKPIAVRKANKELEKQIERRIRFNVLKKQGLV